MEEVLLQSHIKAMDRSCNVVLDIESLTQPSDRCCSESPKMTKALSRKSSYRMDRRCGEEPEAEEASRKLVIKVIPSQVEQLKQPLLLNKALTAIPYACNSPVLIDSGDGRSKRFSRLTTIHPRQILFFFATL